MAIVRLTSQRIDLLSGHRQLTLAGEIGCGANTQFYPHPAPKEQPPRKLSGNKDRKATGTLESDQLSQTADPPKGSTHLTRLYRQLAEISQVPRQRGLDLVCICAQAGQLWERVSAWQDLQQKQQTRN